MLVDSGTSEHYVDSELYPGLQGQVLDYVVLEKPHQITTAGNHVLQRIASGTVTGTVSDITTRNSAFLSQRSYS